MPIDLKIPHVGESITEVQISEWLKSEGDTVKRDESVAVIDSEKTTLELPAPENGILTKILHRAGETVKVGEVVAQVEPGAAEKTKPDGPDKTKEPKSEAAPAAAAKPEKKTSPPPDASKKEGEKSGKPDAANQRQETGSPVKPAAEPPAAPAGEPARAEPATESKEESKPAAPIDQPALGREEKTAPMSMLRRTIAKRLVEAKQQMAMLTTFNEADMSGVQALRQEHQEAFEKRHQTRLGFMSFFVKAAVDALEQFPQLSARIRGNDLVYPKHLDIGVAIASEHGLVVPVLRNAEQMSFSEVEKAIGDFARRAKDSQLKPDELEGGTFTITNGGVFGSLLSTPIINPPQSGILGMHTIQERPVAIKGQVVIRPMMYLALTYDHRIVDGREAVLFLRRIKEIIESPARLLIGI